MGRSDCIYTKNSARPEQLGAMRQKMAIFNETAFGGYIFFRSSHFMFRKNRPFSKRRRLCLPRSLWKDSFKKGRHPTFFPDMYFFPKDIFLGSVWALSVGALIKIRGTMRQKMTIFKAGTAFAGTQKFQAQFWWVFRWKIGGRCDRKCQFSKEETTFAGSKNLRLNFDELKIQQFKF